MFEAVCSIWMLRLVWRHGGGRSTQGSGKLSQGRLDFISFRLTLQKNTCCSFRASSVLRQAVCAKEHEHAIIPAIQSLVSGSITTTPPRTGRPLLPACLNTKRTIGAYAKELSITVETGKPLTLDIEPFFHLRPPNKQYFTRSQLSTKEGRKKNKVKITKGHLYY